MSETIPLQIEALEAQSKKNQDAQEYIQSLMDDESGDDENSWPQIEQFLREHSLTTREPLPERKEAA